MSWSTQIADAVVNQLNNGEFSYPFLARRIVFPDTDLNEIDSLIVSVMPTGLRVEQETRGRAKYTVTVEVAVQAKCVNVNANVAGYGELVDEMIAVLRRTPLSSFPSAICSSVRNEPIVSEEHISKAGVFTSVISADFWFLVTG